MEANLIGDSAETLRLLAPLLEHKKERSWREAIAKNVAKWWDTLGERADDDSRPLNPQRVFAELSPRVPSNALLACDTGTSVHWLSRHVKIRDRMLFAHSGNLASMGAAMPYAIAAKFALPGRPVLAFVGDGAMQMNGLNELITLARYWKRWADPRFVVLVLNNRDLKHGELGAAGFVRFAQVLRLAGSAGVLLRGVCGAARHEGHHPFRAAAEAWDEALACDRPVLVDAIVDPNVPPLPPHVTLKQARNYLSAIPKGDPDALKIVRASVREIFA